MLCGVWWALPSPTSSSSRINTGSGAMRFLWPRSIWRMLFWYWVSRVSTLELCPDGFRILDSSSSLKENFIMRPKRVIDSTCFGKLYRHGGWGIVDSESFREVKPASGFCWVSRCLELNNFVPLSAFGRDVSGLDSLHLTLSWWVNVPTLELTILSSGYTDAMCWICLSMWTMRRRRMCQRLEV